MKSDVPSAYCVQWPVERWGWKSPLLNHVWRSITVSPENPRCCFTVHTPTLPHLLKKCNSYSRSPACLCFFHFTFGQRIWLSPLCVRIFRHFYCSLIIWVKNLEVKLLSKRYEWQTFSRHVSRDKILSVAVNLFKSKFNLSKALNTKFYFTIFSWKPILASNFSFYDFNISVSHLASTTHGKLHLNGDSQHIQTGTTGSTFMLRLQDFEYLKSWWVLRKCFWTHWHKYIYPCTVDSYHTAKYAEKLFSLFIICQLFCH